MRRIERRKIAKRRMHMLKKTLKGHYENNIRKRKYIKRKNNDKLKKNIVKLSKEMAREKKKRHK